MDSLLGNLQDKRIEILDRGVEEQSSLVERCDLARVSQSKSGAVLLKRLALIEGFEYQLTLILRNTYPVVLNADDDLFVLFLYADVNLGFGVLDGVGKEITDYALNGIRITGGT